MYTVCRIGGNKYSLEYMKWDGIGISLYMSISGTLGRTATIKGDSQASSRVVRTT